MKNYVHFYGVDVSKKTVDIAYTDKQVVIHRKFDNDISGMDQLQQWLAENNTSADNTLFCMEATGLYCLTLTNFLYSKTIDVWIEHASTIKRATALARGKNDKVDAQRIASYASKNADSVRLWRPMSVTLEKIKNLATLRERLVDTTKRLCLGVILHLYLLIHQTGKCAAHNEKNTYQWSKGINHDIIQNPTILK